MIRLENVSRQWSEFAIQNVNLEVQAGEYLVIVGPTGAGKTLLLELLLGIHRPDQGQIFLDGKNVVKLPPERRGIAMVYQDYLLFPHLKVEQNLAFGLRYQRVNQEQQRRKVQEAAELLGIQHLLHRYQYTLSGGERQRVAIGRALVTEPRILLLDEPFSALDRRTAHRLRGELKALHEAKGLTILHVTHDLSEARQLGGSIALIHGGKLSAVGSAEELLRRPPNLLVANFVGAVNLYEAQRESANGSGEMRFTVGPISAVSLAQHNGRTLLMVLPDEIALLPAGANGPNLLQGKIVGLMDEGNYVAVSIQVSGLPTALVAYVTRQFVAEHSLALEMPVAADVTRALHLLPE